MLPGPRPSDLAATGEAPLLRGTALIFWDPKRPGHKLDAIDTDQITPATDCVSESLETLDLRWKAGSFRHLMPDFRRARASRRDVRHRRGPVRDRVLARDDAGRAKGVAEEAGLEMVIVAGDNMGDIFRPTR